MTRDIPADVIEQLLTSIPADVIERATTAAKAEMFAPHELPITDDWLNERYNALAVAVLRAAGWPEQRKEIIRLVEVAKKQLMETAGQRALISDLAAGLREAQEKIALYRAEHSGNYVGGVEYTELIRRNEALLAKADGAK